MALYDIVWDRIWPLKVDRKTKIATPTDEFEMIKIYITQFFKKILRIKS